MLSAFLIPKERTVSWKESEANYGNKRNERTVKENSRLSLSGIR